MHYDAMSLVLGARVSESIPIPSTMSKMLVSTYHVTGTHKLVVYVNNHHLQYTTPRLSSENFRINNRGL